MTLDDSQPDRRAPAPLRPGAMQNEASPNGPAQNGPAHHDATHSSRAEALRLDRLPPRTAAVVEGVDDRAPAAATPEAHTDTHADTHADARTNEPGAPGGTAPASGFDQIARRLRELGFVGGERVEVVATGPFGGDPLLVQVGFTRFALRRSEAARVRVRPEAA